MLIEDAFDFGGIDVLAAGNDHVLHPVSDVEEAVIVEYPTSPVWNQPCVSMAAAVASGRRQYPS